MISMETRLERLKKDMNAVILAHNYQPEEVQDAADFVGDSLGLSRQAAKTSADVILFCGVTFMAETAKILSPGKTVLVPDPTAACPMAAMINADDMKRLREEHPGVPVMAYVNTPAAVKAESDVCCTSANAIKVAESLDEDSIIFIPDKHLAAYVQSKTEKRMIPWHGYCPTHAKILPEHIRMQKEAHPGAKVIVHPECRMDVIALADAVASTEGMVRLVKESVAGEFIIGTDIAIIHKMRREAPGKSFYPASDSASCPNMKKTTIAKMINALERKEHEITVDSEVMARSRKAIERMLELA